MDTARSVFKLTIAMIGLLVIGHFITGQGDLYQKDFLDLVIMSVSMALLVHFSVRKEEENKKKEIYQ